MTNTSNSELNVYEERLKIKSFEDGMKLYETCSLQSVIPENRPFILRLNASSYSKINNLLHNKINKDNSILFDKTYQLAMIKTAQLIINDINFYPQTIFTHCDEILIIFNKANNFNRDSHTYISYISSKATNYFRSAFYKIFSQERMKYYSDETLFEIDNSMPVFKAKLIYFPENQNYEILNYIIWRLNKIRNYVQDYCISFINHQELENKNLQEQKDSLKSLTGINMDKDSPYYMTYGVFIKRSIFTDYCICKNNDIPEVIDSNDSSNDSSDDNIQLIDKVIYPVDNIWSMKLKYSDEALKEILDKYYNKNEWNVISDNPEMIFWYPYDTDYFTYPNIEKYYDNNQIIQHKINIIYNKSNNIKLYNQIDYSGNDNNNVKGFIKSFNNRDLNNNFSPYYKAIPVWSLYMMLIHILNIYNNSSYTTIINECISYGWLFSAGIRFMSFSSINSKFYLHDIIFVIWTVFMIIMLFSSAFNWIEYSGAFAIASLTTILYSYYLTIVVGLMFFEYVYTLPKQLTTKEKML